MAPILPFAPARQVNGHQTRLEVAQHDLEFVDNLDILPRQHLLRFRRPGRAPS